jgi:hypothetical protein
MENTLREVRNSVVAQDNNIINHGIRNLDAQELSVEIQKNIKIWNEISNTPNFYQTKLTVGSAALRESDARHIGFQLQIPSTVFGEIYENFVWTFDIEGNSDINKLSNIVYDHASRIKNKQNITKEYSGTRMYSIMSLEHEMKTVFNIIDGQLNYINDEQALLLTSLAFYEIEKLSNNREEDYLLFNDMYNLSNANDKWIACMNVQANYTKPTVNNMFHLMH